MEALRRRQLRDRAAVRVSRGDPLDVLEVRADVGRIALRRQRGEQALVELRAGAEEAARAAEEDDAGVDELAALDPRDDADGRVLEGRVVTPRARASASCANSRGPSSRAARYSAYGAPSARLRGHQCRGSRAGPPARPAARRPPRSTPAAGSSTWSRIAGKPPRARDSGSAPWNAYSDAPWSISHRFLCQRSRFGLRGVRSTLVTSASNHTTSAASSLPGGSVGVYGSAPGRKSTPRFRPGGRDDQVLDLRVRLGGGERRIELDEHELGHRQTEAAGQLPRHDLGGQRLRPLPGAAELAHVQAVVVGLDDRGQRAPFPKGRDVAGGGDRAQHGLA